MSAQSTGAYLDGAEPWTESDCAGDVPIVVGSDAKAQSDIYSAVTLAGVVDTDCVVLAGPRDGDMPADQRERLDAAASTGGFVLGGTAAVPEAKVAGRNLTRLGGATRWETAQLIGSQARALAEGQQPGAPSVPDTTLSAPSDVQQPGVFLHGAEPWIASDCVGDVPIVVGSDAKAQSDIYSAVTLAGVVGTDCVVLAGPRDGDMPASQRTRLDAAASGGYVVGGAAAVPGGKVASRAMARLGGADRWATALLVGREAAEQGPQFSDSGFTAIAAGDFHTCGLRSNGRAECWGHNIHGQSSPPSGVFTAIAAGSFHTCGLRSDGTAECWGNDSFGQSSPPSGVFTAITTVFRHTCGLRSDGTAECWGANANGRSSPPSGLFTAISAGGLHACGLRSDGTAECWGRHYDFESQSSVPSGAFTAISAGNFYTCGLRSDGTAECWGDNARGKASPPLGVFRAIEAGTSHTCGLRSDGTAECWGANAYGRSSPPE